MTNRPDYIKVRAFGRDFEDIFSAMAYWVTWMFGYQKRYMKEYERGANKAMKTVYTEMRNLHGSKWNGQTVNPTDRLQKRTGKGLKSIGDSRYFAYTSGKGATGRNYGQNQFTEFGMSTGTMGIHETGGVITPRRSKYLTVPLPAALNRDGTPKKKSARKWKNTFVIKSKKGNLIIMQNRGRGKKPVPLYVLKPSVRIRPRLGLNSAWDRHVGLFLSKWGNKVADTIERGPTSSSS